MKKVMRITMLVSTLWLSAFMGSAQELHPQLIEAYGKEKGG